MKKTVLTSFTALCLLSTLFLMELSFGSQPVEAGGIIHIRADGSVDPPTAPISTVDNVTYTLTGNVSDSIWVERDNIVVDGAGYMIQEKGGQWGIALGGTNVTVKNTEIKAFDQGIHLVGSYGNSIIGNDITNNGHGIYIDSSSNNTISGNNITKNTIFGIRLYGSSNNSVVENNITKNENNITRNSIGIELDHSSNNKIFHNNFINNDRQVRSIAYERAIGFVNIWDDGYPSGGNYWSDYTGEDVDGDCIGDTPYIIDANNTDSYPRMTLWPPPEHELVASIEAPTSLWLGSSSSLNATVINKGSSDETDVELDLLINGTTVDSTTVPLLQASNSHTLNYLWTATTEGTYNVTAYVHPVPGEASVENNQVSGFVAVSAPPEVGIKAGDWIKLEYTISGWPAGQPYPEWLKVEFLSVEGTSATVRVTMHMSDGMEENATVPVDVVAGGQALGLSGFVIPANLTTGYSVYITGYGNITIEGEATRTYAGASRTVVYASFSQYGTQLTYYWDKHTGVMVEASTTSAGVTATAKVTETNMWEAAPSPFWMQWWLWAIVGVVVVALTGAVYTLRKRKAPTTPVPSPENTDQSR